MSLTAYEGKEPYIFVSYAHKDSSLVLPLIEALQHEGFRVWFDQGIEAGTEWPEYIEDRLCDCNSMIVFMSNNAVDSLNCRNEINLALSIHKELLVIYLEQTELRHGMRLQLSSVNQCLLTEVQITTLSYPRSAVPSLLLPARHLQELPKPKPPYHGFR